MRAVLARIFEGGPYGPWTTIWVMAAMAWWSGQEPCLRVSQPGIAEDGVTQPEFGVLGTWRPTHVPFSIFSWLFCSDDQVRVWA